MGKAKEMARDVLGDGQPVQLHTIIPPAFRLEGMTLSKGRKPPPERLKTTMMLDQTRYAAARLSGRTPTDSEIWQAINHKDITRMTRAYLWRTIHQANKIGEYWRNKPTFEHFAECRHCNVDNSMEHSLIGSILVCIGKDRGADRLYRIPISETAHQIWKLRCIQVIEHGSDPSRYFSEAEIQNKWLACINSRLRSDIILTDRKKVGNRALNFKMVCSTWNGVLKDNKNLTGTKIGQSRV
ncbi:hypothetical protein B0H14DRAFT_3094075 [Mycena olivaceomarginata]|nr:hypothetical protein B0H14DRAFT_3094075 [Mycena olivaceomarginata]